MQHFDCTCFDVCYYIKCCVKQEIKSAPSFWWLVSPNRQHYSTMYSHGAHMASAQDINATLITYALMYVNTSKAVSNKRLKVLI